jgi:2,3-bisphosphoglycerate-independent phosphoglycerate mutase
MQAALVVLDGWGLGDGGPGDAVAAADTPTFDRLREAGAAGALTAHGRAVGLPEGQMGNSEVGHLTVGAGRVVEQPYTRIEDAIDGGRFGDNEALASAFDRAAASGGRVHVCGLLSDGGVHAAQRHVHALIDVAADRGVPAVTHAFTDGRDTPPTSGEGYLADLAAHADARDTGDAATVSGRYYAMDRDGNWDRTKRAYDAVVDRVADRGAETAVAAVRAAYDRGETDEFVEPTLVDGGPALADGDAVVFANFRADRARQLVRMLADVDPSWPFETSPPDVRVVTMTEYDSEFDLPVAFPPIEPTGTLGEALAGAGLTQLRVAESEKYAHVTYFLDGGREAAFEGERRRIVESPDVPTYDEAPAMSAGEVTDATVEALASDDPDVVVLNYANPDMVGHTGDFGAAVAAVEAVDAELGRLADAVRDAGGHLLVLADHGNADEMGTPDDPHTAHTFAPVPFVYVSPDGGDGGYRVREGGELADVGPTLLSLVGVDAPAEMTGASLLVR